MNSYLDDALVGLLLLVSAAYALSALGPRHLRRRVLAVCGGWLARAPAALGLRRVAQAMAREAQTPASACGGCDNCATEKPSSRAATDAAAVNGAAEIKIPLNRIGRARR
jgi:hypothetical protein